MVDVTGIPHAHGNLIGEWWPPGYDCEYTATPSGGAGRTGC